MSNIEEEKGNIPRFLSLLDKNQLNIPEQVIFGSIKTLFVHLLNFSLGKHEKFSEVPDISKLILTGINRTEFLKNNFDSEVLAKNYKDFFVITQFFQSSYRASQGTFIERLVAELDPNKNIAIEIKPKHLVAYLREPLLCRLNSLRKASKQQIRNLKKLRKETSLKFNKKFSESKIDITTLLNSNLIFAEQRSTDVTGGTTAVQSNFEKANQFLMELELWLNNPKSELNKLFLLGCKSVILNLRYYIAPNKFFSILLFFQNRDFQLSHPFSSKISSKSFLEKFALRASPSCNFIGT